MGEKLPWDMTDQRLLSNAPSRRPLLADFVAKVAAEKL
jgi:hypothetical protein